MPSEKASLPLRIEDGSVTAYLYPVTTGTAGFEIQPDPAHHVTRVTRSWNSSDVAGSLHVLSYLVVFRPSTQPPPAVSGLTLKAGAGGASAAAKVDGAPLAISFQN